MGPQKRGDAELQRVDVPCEEAYGWRVEQEFIEAIRGQGEIELTDFATGVCYMGVYRSGSLAVHKLAKR